MEKIDDFWSMNEGTFACLHDSKRTLAFKKAIKKIVHKGDVVVDLGAGSGILSMFAIDSGASKVYAVELDKGNIKSLQNTIDINGYKDKIIVIEGDATTIALPEKVDFVICEMIATGLIEELQVPAMNNIISFFKPSTLLLIESYAINIELVSSKNIFYKKQFNIIRFELPEMRDMRSVALSNKQNLTVVDFNKKNEVKINKKITLKATTKGIVNGIKITGQTFLSNGETFDSSTSYSFPLILPTEDISVRKGDELQVSISYLLSGGPSSLKYTVKKLL